MEPDAQETPEPTEDRPTCPECGHVNIPGAAFCARCGRSLGDDSSTGDVIDVPGDTQATSTFEPVTSTVTPPPESPWARPDPVDSDPGVTTALPAPDYMTYTTVADSSSRAFTREPRGMRGFWLGVIGTLLILAVLAIYLYTAWLSDSTRSTIAGWLPWT